MATKAELAALRKQVMAGQSRVKRKMSRAAREHGVKWNLQRNASAVVLVDSAKVKRYTEKQLRSVLAKQEAFISRKNIIRADAYGRVLNPELVRKNRSLELRWENKAQREWARVADVPAYLEEYGRGQTLDTLRKTHTPSMGLGAHDESESLGNVSRRQSYRSIRSEAALERINEALEHKLRSEYFDERKQRLMSSLEQQLSIYGDRGIELYDRIGDLGDNELKLLIEDPAFWRATKVTYELIKAGYTGDITAEDALGDINTNQFLGKETKRMNDRIMWAQAMGRKVK